VSSIRSIAAAARYADKMLVTTFSRGSEALAGAPGVFFCTTLRAVKAEDRRGGDAP